MAINKYYYIIILISLLSGFFFILFLRNISLKHRIFAPKGTPTIGGIGLGLSFFASALLGMYLFMFLDKKIIGILVSSFLMCVFGVIDDRYELSVMAKIIAQSIAISVLILYNARTQIAYIGAPINIIITFIWIIGITNAVNHLDIIDGLAALVVLIIDFTFLIIGITKGDINTIILTLALGGALISLLIFNFPPAKIYMGNSGSHLLGFILAVIAISISYAPLERRVALFSPVLILGLPIFDTIFLIIRRLSRSLSPLKKSNDHFAFGLLKLGFSNKKVLLSMSIIAAFFAFSGVLLSRVNNLSGMFIIALVIIVCFLLARKIDMVLSNG